MDEKTIKEVDELLTEISGEADMAIDEIIVFGSRAREDYREQSDIDIIVVSPDFRDVVWNKRPGKLYTEWNYEELPTPEFICLTPEEFEEKKQKDPHIIRTAVEEGISLA